MATKSLRGYARRAFQLTGSTGSAAATPERDAPPSGASRAPGRGRSAARRDILSEYEGLLPPPSATRRIVVLTDEEPTTDVARHVEALGAGQLHVIAPAEAADAIHELGATFHPASGLNAIDAVLRRIGAPDVLLNVMEQNAVEHGTAWERLFFHVAPGGAYILVRQAICAAGEQPSGAVPPKLLKTLQGAGGPATLTAPEKELGNCTSRVLLDRQVLVVGKRSRHFLKVRDAEANELLPARLESTRLRVLASVPGGTIRGAGQLTSHHADVPIGALDREMTYPELHLREYRGRIGMVSNALLFTEDTLLPDSFRHHLTRDLRNVRLRDWGGHFAGIPKELWPQKELAGTYYHLDSENSGHYGHLMTEVISRLWGWDAAKREHPDLKAIFRIRYEGERDPILERRIFGAYGIAPEDVVWVHQPVWLENVIAATPMWHNQIPHSVHPGMADTWRRIGDGLVDPRVEPKRWIFVSRKQAAPLNRGCHNAIEVEEFFAARGFEVVYPESLDLSEQAGLFAQAEVVAGFGGSGLYNVLYAQKLRTLIVLNHEAYTARGEHLFATMLGCDTHYFWSTPDVPHPPGRWSDKAYYSSWTFDFDRNAADLDEVIAGLD